LRGKTNAKTQRTRKKWIACRGIGGNNIEGGGHIKKGSLKKNRAGELCNGVEPEKGKNRAKLQTACGEGGCSIREGEPKNDGT